MLSGRGPVGATPAKRKPSVAGVPSGICRWLNRGSCVSSSSGSAQSRGLITNSDWPGATGSDQAPCPSVATTSTPLLTSTPATPAPRDPSGPISNTVPFAPAASAVAGPWPWPCAACASTADTTPPATMARRVTRTSSIPLPLLVAAA